MIVAHQHNGLFVRIVCRWHVSKQRLQIDGYGAVLIVGSRHCAAKVGRPTIVGIQPYVVSRVTQIVGSSEVSLNGNGCHTVGHDVVATLCIDVSRGFVEVFIRAVAVREVVVLKCCSFAACDAGNLPSRAYFAIVCIYLEFVGEG